MYDLNEGRIHDGTVGRSTLIHSFIHSWYAETAVAAMLCDRGRGFLNAVSRTGHAHASSCMRFCDLRHGADGKYNNAQARARIENKSPGYWVCRGGVMNYVSVWMCIIMIMYITCACESPFGSFTVGCCAPRTCPPGDRGRGD